MREIILGYIILTGVGIFLYLFWKNIKNYLRLKYGLPIKPLIKAFTQISYDGSESDNGMIGMYILASVIAAIIAPFWLPMFYGWKWFVKIVKPIVFTKEERVQIAVGAVKEKKIEPWNSLPP